jgi:hypothetical protein
VYTSPDYPRSCGTYKCKVLRGLLDEDINLPNALTIIRDTLEQIRELEQLLPDSQAVSFRERLIAHKEALEKLDEQGYGLAEKDFLVKAGELLTRYEDQFGVDDFMDYDS